jgi:predicted RecB family nuclease
MNVIRGSWEINRTEGAKESALSVPISDKLFLNYLHCKYKAYLMLSGKSGIKGDYEKFQDDQVESYRLRVREHFQQTNQIIPLAEAISTFKYLRKQKSGVATNVSIVNDRYDLILDAAELTSQAPSQKPVYHPILFLPHQKITKKDKLLLAFCGSALSHEQKVEPTTGKIIFGDKFSSLKIQLTYLIKAAGKVEKEIGKTMETHTAPPLRLNDHCKMCGFQAGCMAAAKDKDDLSLLKGLSGKEIDALNKRGIFTVTQYSYTFRPRRAKKQMTQKIVNHHHSLNALAILTQTVYIAGKPELPAAPTRVYLDVEGIPGENFYYLIGLIIDDGTNVTAHSFWADDKSEERTIWKSFIGIIEHITNCALFHYGSYETKFIKQMGLEYGGNTELLEKIRSRCFNVLSAIYGRIYFSMYSNDLKSIASLLGFKWSERNASGLMSVLWRQQWEKSKDPAWKEKIVTYNHEDCFALRAVEREIRRISQNTASATACLTKNIDEIRADKPHGIFKKNDFYFPELDKINNCAYFDYQQSRVYCRTNKAIKRRLKKINSKSSLNCKANKVISIDRLLSCPYCGFKKPRKDSNYSRTVYDMKLFDGGIRRWIVRYTYKRYSCETSNRRFLNNKRDAGISRSSQHLPNIEA